MSCIFNALKAGDYTVCGVPFFQDASGAEKEKQSDARRVVCLDYHVLPAPPLQSAVLNLPGMEMMPWR